VNPLRARSIRSRLLLWNLSVFGSLLLGVVLAGYLYAVRQIKRDKFEQQSEIATLVAARIETFVEQKIDRLREDASSLSSLPMGGRTLESIAVQLLKNNPVIVEASVLNAGGLETVKVSLGKIIVLAKLVDQSNTQKFMHAIEGEIYIGPVSTSEKTEPHMTVALPLKDKAAKIVGVLSAEVNLTFLREVIRNIRFGAAGYAYLSDSRGNLIAHRDMSLVLKGTKVNQLHEVQEFFSNPNAGDPTPTDESYGIAGERVISTYAPLHRLGWAVVLEEPVEVALADVKVVQFFALLLIVVGLGVGALLILWLSHRITKPIRELQRGVELIRGGDLDHRVEIDTADEIQSLGHEFNQMAKDLKAAHAGLEQKVEQRTREMSALFEVTTTLNRSLDPEPVLQAAIKKINGIFHFEVTRILLVEAGERHFDLRGSHQPEFSTRVLGLQRGQGITGRVAETGEELIFEDISSDPTYELWSHSSATQRNGLRFLAVFPIRTKSECVGVLFCAGKTPRRLPENELKLIRSMTDQIGVAIENATLFAAVSAKSKALEKANDDLIEANRIKSGFMAGMSHELRTPLNIIMGNVELLKDGFFGDMNTGQIKSLSQITHHTRVLLKLINNVLTLTKIEAQKMSLEAAQLHVEEVIAHVRGYSEQLARNGRVEIRWAVESDLPTIITDAVKLEEILQNLIGNAYKFTPNGHIEIRVRNLAVTERIEFAVADTGIGIEREALGRIFDEFHQLQDAHTGNFDGFGLGLNIVKKYLDLMGGDIRVESEPGVGSTFTFTLPCAADSVSVVSATGSV
jgi:two-component system sensor histidine kinase/response regulator